MNNAQIKGGGERRVNEFKMKKNNITTNQHKLPELSANMKVYVQLHILETGNQQL